MILGIISEKSVASLCVFRGYVSFKNGCTTHHTTERSTVTPINRVRTTIAIAVVSLFPAFAAAAPSCAPTKDDEAAVAQAYTKHDADVTRLAATMANAKGDALLNALEGMVSATKSLRGATTSFSKEYCERARKTVDTLFGALTANYQGEDRVRYLMITERIAGDLGVPLSSAQNSEITAAVKPVIEKAVKDLDDAVAKKDVDGIEKAHSALGQFANTEIGKSMGVTEKRKAAVDAYRAIEQAARKAPDTTKLLADARTALTAGNYREALRAIETAEEAVDKPTAEMTTLRKELSDKWLADEFGKADKAMGAVKAAVTDQSVAGAANALRSACNLARRLDVKNDRCNASR